ncbi:uncharacterized protein LOC143959998 [Lithobates pipiens]
MEDGTEVTQRILNITLEIIYLLTGEDYIIVKKPGGRTTNSNRLQVVEGFCRKQNSIFVPPPHSLPSERSEEKILELTNKITELLTGEVPIRCQDVTVYFSMEEWEYLEGHKDLYKDVMMANQPPLTSPDAYENRPTSGDHYFPMVTSDCETEDSMVIDEGPEGIDPYEEDTEPQDIDPYEEDIGPQDIDPYEENTEPQDIDSYEDMGLEIIYPYHGDMEPEGLDPYEGDTRPEAIDLCKRELRPEGMDPYEGDTGPKGKDPCKREPGSEGIDPYEGDTGPKGKDPCKREPGSEGIDPYKGDMGPKGIDPCKREPRLEGIDPYEGDTGPKGIDPCKLATTTSSMKGFPVRIKEEPVSDEEESLAGNNYANQIAYSCVRIKEEPQLYVEVKIPSEGEDRTPQAYCHIKVETVPAEEDDRSTPTVYTPSAQGHSTATHIKEEPVAFVNVLAVSQQADHTHEQPSNAAAETMSYKVEMPTDQAPAKGSDNSSLYSVRQKEDSMEILYHCPSCFKGFSSNLDLARHQVIHTVSKLFICSLCGKSFTEMSFLVKHQVIHTDLKLCVCPVCGGCFYSETSLAKHQKTHSLPLFCSTCGKCFFNKTELAIHERKHSGERPFACHICGKNFIAKSVLNKHMMIHGPMDIGK